MSTRRAQPDMPTVIVSVIGVLIQLGLGLVFWGRTVEKIDTLDKREAAQESAASSLRGDLNQERTDVAVLQTKLDGIKSVVDRVDGKLDKRG